MQRVTKSGATSGGFTCRDQCARRIRGRGVFRCVGARRGVNGRGDPIARHTAFAPDRAISILRCKDLFLSRENLWVQDSTFLVKGIEPVDASAVPFNETTVRLPLILAAGGRIQLVELDAEIDLRDCVDPRFYALQSDRVISCTVDEIDQVWGNETIPVDLLVKLLAVRPERELVLERAGEPDIVLSSGGTVSLAGKVVEHLHTHPKAPHDLVEVTVFTTSGTFPEEGALRVTPDTPVSRVLARAAAKLGLTDTADWVVTVGGRDPRAQSERDRAGLLGREVSRHQFELSGPRKEPLKENMKCCHVMGFIV
jgi:hypothetical protein